MSSNFLARVFTSIVLLSLVLWVFFLGEWALYCLIMIVVLISCKELFDMVKKNYLIFFPLIIIMVIIPYSALIYVYSTNRNMLIWLMFCIWVTDIFAYFSGKIIGGKKLFPSISPNKTCSGLVGAIAMSTLFGLIFAYFLKLPYYFFFLGPLVTITAQLGDFFESGIKRIYQVNDSSSILPGHGGILDRMDGIIFTAPVFAFLLSKFI
ncbi:MAG: phosphatidate cytidylyltransferase [Rickettsiaceae bacterium H1]|nr:phosphatidate cytidylyltransferase [Rickettsiaceae bacterium H1]